MGCAFFSLSCLSLHSSDAFIQLITLNALNCNDLHMKVVEAVSGTIYCFQIKREAADCVYSIQYISPEEI